ncbi:MAG: reverse transcriptase domain-containing protein [Bacilli bacterium]|jgi:RNA-directed DNA polymerase
MNNLILTEEKGDISLNDVFRAYYLCRKNKRNKLECLEFDLDYEENLIKLWEEIKLGIYKIESSSVFIVDKPVKREICAASFRDRIVHHLIVLKLGYLFEKEFIDDSYSCRKGKGTHYGIKRLDRHIRRASTNYQKETYVLKLDIKGYFMSINKGILLSKLEKFINDNYMEDDKAKILWLCQLIIYNDITKNCVFHSSFEKWDDLPKSKSLFHTKDNCGLPIGNYTSQVFSNFYLSSFDHFVKSELKIKHYGRYVDDFFLVSNSKEELKRCIPKIRKFLLEELDLELHPKKIYLQNINNGVEFLGSYIKPWRIYITPRIKNNFYLTVKELDKYFDQEDIYYDEGLKIREKLNSYLGIVSHYDTYLLRRGLLRMLNDSFERHFFIPDWARKIVLKGCFKWRDF